MYLFNVSGISPSMLKTKQFQGVTFYYRENTADESVLGHSFEKDIFYQELYDLQDVNGMTIIDVGAHIGTFTTLSSIKFPDARIISIEPNPDTYEVLKKNIAANQIKNITPISAALNDTPDPVKLYLSDENWEHSITSNVGASYVEVNAITLEQIFANYEINECDLIKMNCEGAEFNIILNTPKEILQRIKMMLILFHEDLVTDEHNRKSLIDYFTHSGGFIIRKANMSKQRGWLIVKNKNFYYDRPWSRVLDKLRSVVKL